MENEIYSGSGEFANFGDIPMDYLMHYGIKGQKWGVRRYQNKDGSLTKAGRKRYAKLEAEMEKLGGKKYDSDAQNKPKKARDMTDDELRTAINRMRMEDEYNRMYNQLHPQKVKSGHKYVETLITAGMNGLAEGGKQLIRDALIKKGKEALGIKDEKPKSAYEKLKEQYDYKKLEKDFDELLNGKAKDLQEEADAKLAKEATRLTNKMKVRKAQEWFSEPEHTKDIDEVLKDILDD